MTNYVRSFFQILLNHLGCLESLNCKDHNSLTYSSTILSQYKQYTEVTRLQNSKLVIEKLTTTCTIKNRRIALSGQVLSDDQNSSAQQLIFTWVPSHGRPITRHIKTLQDTGLQNVRDLETCM